ncbi:MAG: FliM/FliN family flagellar motor switch protein, partial [Actinomycetota bacterium]
SLAVGDVLRLDHRVGQTVEGVVGDAVVLEGHPGRRGRRLALQVTDLVMPRRPLDLAEAEPKAGAEPAGDLPAPAEPAPSASRASDRERSLA